MTLTAGLSAAAAGRGENNKSGIERMNNRRRRGFMGETFSAIRQNKQALSGAFVPCPCTQAFKLPALLPPVPAQNHSQPSTVAVSIRRARRRTGRGRLPDSYST